MHLRDEIGNNNINVLIIEEDLSDQKEIQLSLVAAGFNVTSSMKPFLDKAIINNNFPDVVLCNYKVRNVGVADIMNTNIDLIGKKPVIVLFDYFDENRLDDIFSSGYYEYLIKKGDYLENLPFFIYRCIKANAKKGFRKFEEGHSNDVEIPGDFFRKLVNSIPDPFFIKDSDLKYIAVNEAFCEFIMREPDVIIGKADSDIFPQEVAANLEKTDKAVMEGGGPKEHEETLTDINGDKHIIQMISSFLDSPGNDDGFIVGIIQDVTIFRKLEKRLEIYRSRLEELVEERTVELMNANEELELEIAERQRIQEALWETNIMLELVMDSIPQYIYWKDRNSVYLGCNENFAKAAGVASPDDITGKTDFELQAYQEEADNIRQDDRRIMDSDKPEYNSIEVRLNSSGENAWIETNKIPLHDSSGKVVGILCTSEDITQRVLTDQALRRSEKKYRKIFELSPDAILLIDRGGRIVDINGRIKDWTGYHPVQVTGKKVKELDFLSEESKIISGEFFHKMISGAGTEPFEIDFTGFNGEKRTGWIFASPIFDENNELSNLLIMVTDITERKKYERKLSEFNRELEEKVYERTSQLQNVLNELQEEIKARKITEVKLKSARDDIAKALQKEKELSELKTRFISMISHEYRTPLTVIQTSTYIIEKLFEGSDTEEFIRFLDKIRTSVENMIQLHDNVLTIGKGETGTLDLNLTEVELVGIIDRIIEEHKFIEEKKHKYEFTFNTDECTITSDPKLLKRVFNNLISNASKYSGTDSAIRVDMEENMTDIIVKIKDEGIGISKEDLPHLFEPFHRGRNIGTVSGTGLGLSIVKSALNSLGGDIDVTSEVNRGTEFILTIPKKSELNMNR